MCTEAAASAPEFFLHHAFVDKIWSNRQNRGYFYKNEYFPTNRTLMLGNLNGHRYYTTEFIDLLRQPGCVKVSYAMSPRVNGKRDADSDTGITYHLHLQRL